MYHCPQGKELTCQARGQVIRHRTCDIYQSEEGKRVYARRLGIVEPVFANICVQKRMHRFTLRSKRKVDVQWRLFALVHDIGKIHAFGAPN